MTLHLAVLASISLLAYWWMPDVPSPNLKYLALVAGVAFFAGARPIVLEKYKTQMIASHPLILFAIFMLGPLEGVLTGLSGVLGAAVLRKGWPSIERFVFNLMMSMTTTMLAALVFWRTYNPSPASQAEINFEQFWLPSFLSAMTYALVNGFGVASIVAATKNGSIIREWKEGHVWAIPSNLVGWTIAIGMIAAQARFGWAALVFALPPCWLLLAFYANHRQALQERDRRLRDMDALNHELRETINRLENARTEVRILRGLLPICSFCKEIRNEDGVWNKLEVYVEERSEATFSHSVCDSCRREHYPDSLPAE